MSFCWMSWRQIKSQVETCSLEDVKRHFFHLNEKSFFKQLRSWPILLKVCALKKNVVVNPTLLRIVCLLHCIHWKKVLTVIFSNHRLINMPFCLLFILSTYYFNMQLFLLFILSTCYFINLPFNQHAILSTCRLINMPYCLLVNLLTFHFAYLPL
jgi:hypothetical protein